MHIGAAIWMSVPIQTSVAKKSTKKVIVMILYAVQNRIHVSVPVAVHVERACSEYMCPRAQLDYTQDFQSAVISPMHPVERC